MKKSTSNQKSVFGTSFAAISAAVRANETSALASATSTVVTATSALSARGDRLKAIRAYIKGGGTLTAAQRKKLSPPELIYVAAIEAGEDPDIKAAIKKLSSNT